MYHVSTKHIFAKLKYNLRRTDALFWCAMLEMYRRRIPNEIINFKIWPIHRLEHIVHFPLCKMTKPLSPQFELCCHTISETQNENH